jgi:LPS-assembly lipoprotein
MIKRLFPVKPILLLMLMATLVMSGCGWQLQGGSNSINQTGAISISANDVYSSLYRDLDKELQRQGFSVTKGAATSNIHLINEEFKSEVRSLSTRLDPAEQEVELQIHYRINGGQKQTHFIRSSHTEFRHKTAGRANERSILRDEMRLEALRKIIQQYQIISKNQKSSGEDLP